MKTAYEPKWVTGTDKYKCTAQFSECGNYRWAFSSLTDFHGPEKTAWWQMINPANGEVDDNDNTMKSCRRISTNLECTRFNILNFYPKRTPKVRDLSDKWLKEISIQEHFDVLGANFMMQQMALKVLKLQPEKNIFILACGAYQKHPQLKSDVAKFMDDAKGLPIMCLGYNKDGSPEHPLFKAANTPLVPFEIKELL
jgi:hypothetical protein